MKVKLGYGELASALSYVNTVLSDKTVDDKLKNIIFLIKKETALIVGYSPLTFSRTELSNVETEGLDEEGSWEFQVKASDLNKIISCYSSLYKTKVEYIELEEDKSKIRAVIHEEAIKEEDAHLSQVSKFSLDNIPILASVSKDIHIDFPEDVDSILSNDLLLYIDSLFPLMNNDSSNSLTSKLHFKEDYVFVMASYINSFFENKLPDSFKNITLGYSSVNFLKKLCNGADSIDIQKTGMYLCIKSGNTEAFLKFQKVGVKTAPIINRKSEENGIVLDRLYFKDVLKRLSLSAQDGVVKMTDLGLEVSNDVFTQVIPLLKEKGEVSSIKFKVSVPVLEKTIVGDDGVFPGEIFIYFVKSGTGYILFVRDETDGWFSTIQVRM